MVNKSQDRDKTDDIKKVEGTKTVNDADEISTKKSGTKIEDPKELPNDQIKLGEPVPSAQDLRKEVRADADVTNPESGDNTPTNFKVADNEGKTAEAQQKETQDGLMDQLNRKPENK